VNKKPTLDEDMKLCNEVLQMVIKELGRQRDKYGVQRYPGGWRWLSIQGEEFGEICESMQVDTAAAKDTDADDTLTELIQNAAVSISWAAQELEQKKRGEGRYVSQLRKGQQNQSD
jgi:hypothetical protein